MTIEELQALAKLSHLFDGSFPIIQAIAYLIYQYITKN